MLHQFLSAERDHILALCFKNGLVTSGVKPSTHEMGRGLPLFYDELIDVLQKVEEASSEGKEAEAAEYIDQATAAQHGEEALKLGYTVSQVVHGYGGICQGITEYAQLKGEQITNQEFSCLNLCLDIVIAEAVTAFDRVKQEINESKEVERLGFLVHELRNALSNITMSYQQIKEGTVGAGGNTSRVLENALTRMRDLIDRSLTEVRLRSLPSVNLQRESLLRLVSEVEAAALPDARAKLVQFSIDVSPTLEIDADHHFMVSALGNLVQNAIKFTKIGSTVWIRASVIGKRIIIEVEDQCGGLSEETLEDLFQPFVQRGSDQSGIGLGLAICRQAIQRNGGDLRVRNSTGGGCIFSIDLPVADKHLELTL